MISLLIRIVINLASAAVGLIVSSLVLPDFQVQPSGFVVAVAVLTIAQSVLGPFVFNVARQSAPALLGGIGIVSTLLALVIAAQWPGGITVSSLTTWVLAAIIVWTCTALGSWLLVAYVLKRLVAKRG